MKRAKLSIEGLSKFCLEVVAPASQPRRIALAAACVLIFSVALAVRLFYWQDMGVEVSQGRTMVQGGIAHMYRDQAARLIETSSLLFATPSDPGDAGLVIHPPGYGALMAALSRLTAKPDSALRILNAVCGSFSAVMVCLIAVALLRFEIAVAAGLLVSLSPHFGYYAGFLTPETLTVLPILLAIFLMTKASGPRAALAFAGAGAMIGLSCWLRANALLLAPFCALLTMTLVERGRRLRCSLALLVAAVTAIAPVTIHNWIAFHRFIPLSIGGGITMIEGIADYDHDDRFGMPKFDNDVGKKEAEWYGRPDYRRRWWVPDGVDRDHARFERGLAIARSNPGWFLSTMARRAANMVRYNDFDRQNDPTNTTVAPSISRTATFGHDPDSSAGRAPVWSAAAHDLLAAGEVVSPFARVSLQDGDLEVAGGEETDSDQVVFAPLAVQKRTDYLLVLSLNRTEEGLALKIRTADPRIVIADTLAPISGPKRSRKSRPIGEPADAPILWRVPLATGQLDEVRPILTRDSTTGIRPVVRISGAELFELGPTPGQWTNPIREAMVGIQKNVYKTRIMRLLLALGLILLVAGMRKRVLVLLLSVPAYFILFQSAFHTEYRYILPPHHILFILIATGLVGWTVAIAHAGRWIFARFSANSRAS